MSSALIFSGALMLMFVSGCSTPYDLKKKDPIISYVTARSAKDVKKCILDKWRLHLNNVNEEKTAEGWLIRFNDTLESATVAIVTIEGQAPTVNVNYYHRTNRIKIDRLEDEVKECK